MAFCKSTFQFHNVFIPYYSGSQYPELNATLSNFKMSLIITALYSGCLSLGFAAPVTNRTTLKNAIAPLWVADPSGRGTWGILSSCVFTLVLCVYTAIHLNIPAKNDSKYTFWLRKIKWVFIAIFGPEVVVLTALDQWLSAKRLLTRLRDPAQSIDKVCLQWQSILILSIVYALTLLWYY